MAYFHVVKFLVLAIVILQQQQALAMPQGGQGASGGVSDFFNGFISGLTAALQGGVSGANSIFNGFGSAANNTFNGLLVGYNATSQGLVQGSANFIGEPSNRP